MSKYETWKATAARGTEAAKAKSCGKKKDLIERLEACDQNANFADLPLIQEIWKMNVPESATYRDVTGNTLLPLVSSKTVQEYLMPLGTQLDKSAEKLYNDRFVKFIRMSEDTDAVFLKSACCAEMFKKTTYEIFLKRDKFGNIEVAQCECTAGAGPECSCKHLRAVTKLLGNGWLIRLSIFLQIQESSPNVAGHPSCKYSWGGVRP